MEKENKKKENRIKSSPLFTTLTHKAGKNTIGVIFQSILILDYLL